MDATEVESQEPSRPENVLEPRKPRLNKYALACALLASTTSILLGYGNSGFFCIFFFFLPHLVDINQTSQREFDQVVESQYVLWLF